MTENPKRKPIDLPIPYSGATDEVLFELTLDYTHFAMKAVGNLHHENPHLSNLLIDCRDTANQTISLRYALAYYELLRRSAEREGVTIPVVSKKTLGALLEERVDRSQRSQQLEPKGQMVEMRKIFSEVNSRIKKDRERSPELDMFWEEIKIQCMMLTRRGLDELSAFFVFEPLFTFQEALQRQTEANAMNEALRN